MFLFVAATIVMMLWSEHSHIHDALEQTHQMDIVNASCSGESEEMKQFDAMFSYH